MQFAISLSGEPTIYPHIGELIEELNKRSKTSFVVTNGLYPEKLKEMAEKNQLPTQIYVSVNAPNKKLYDKIHRSCEENAWGKLNESLEIFSEIKDKTRTVVRINLVKDLNMIEPENYAKMILKANSDFVEVKSYMAVGFSRKRLKYEQMPSIKEILNFSEKISELTGYRIEDYSIASRVVLLKKDASINRFISKADL